jgi:hypothetical protein
MSGDRERADGLLARADRMAAEAVDGPGMGAVLLVRAEMARLAGDPQQAREALDGALNVFYGVTGLSHYAAWVNTQHAFLSLDVGDIAEAAHRVELARNGFTDCGTRLGLSYCAALDERLRVANGLLTDA